MASSSDSGQNVSKNKRKRVDSNSFPTSNPHQTMKLDAKIQQSRKNLPVWSGKEAIVEAVRKNDTVVVLGETGSGKTTQIPQFLYEAGLAPAKTQIGITQPRRVAATSLAQRVSAEMGQGTIFPLKKDQDNPNAKSKGKGKGAGKLVGYSIRFDDRSRYETKIKFMTDGWLVREMVAGTNRKKPHQNHHLGSQNDGQQLQPSVALDSSKLTPSLLPQYSVLIIDEAHERTIRTDLILGLAKRIQRERKMKRKEWILKGREKGKEVLELKIIVMSATLDAETFANYFSTGLEMGKSGFLMKMGQKNRDEVESSDGEDEEEDELGLISSSNKSKKPKISSKPSLKRNHVPILYVKGRQHSVILNHTTEPVDDFPLAALKTILQIHTTKPRGDILVFMTGQEDIENLCSNLRLYEKDLKDYWNSVKGKGKVKERESNQGDEGEEEEEKEGGFQSMMILSLYSSLGPKATEKIFSPTPSNCRKIVVATNIAETSITIPGIKYVIDSGFSKEKNYDSQSSIESLISRPISKSNAIQRSGRAGRESSGECFRLYTLKDFNQLSNSVLPEILKCNLESEFLDLFDLGIDPIDFDWLDHPGIENMNNTLLSLAQLGAIENSNSKSSSSSSSPSSEKPTNEIKLQITSLGKQLNSLPVSPTMSRSLIESLKYGPRISRLVRDLISVLESEKSTLFSEPDLNDDFKMNEFIKIKAEFTCRSGDHGTYLNVLYSYLAFCKGKENELKGKIRKIEEKSQNQNSASPFTNHAFKTLNQNMKEEISNWCKRNYLNERTLKDVLNIRKQLIEICEKNGIVCDDQPSFQNSLKSTLSDSNQKANASPSSDAEDSEESEQEEDDDDDDEEAKESSSKGLSVTRNSTFPSSFKSQDDLGKEETYEEVRKCLLVGRKNKIGMRQNDGSYKIIHGKETFKIFPGSVLHSRNPKPDVIVFEELAFTRQILARTVSIVEPSWLT